MKMKFYLIFSGLLTIASFCFGSQSLWQEGNFEPILLKNYILQAISNEDILKKINPDITLIEIVKYEEALLSETKIPIWPINIVDEETMNGIVIEGTKSNNYDEIKDITFSEDGEKVALGYGFDQSFIIFQVFSTKSGRLLSTFRYDHDPGCLSLRFLNDDLIRLRLDYSRVLPEYINDKTTDLFECNIENAKATCPKENRTQSHFLHIKNEENKRKK